MQRRTWILWCGLTPLASASRAHGEGGHRPSPPQASREQKPWGRAGEPRAVSRTVRLVMDDRMRFTPSQLTVRQGQTLRLRFHNRGQVMHEFVLGTAAELKAHAELMQRFPDMEHDEPDMAHVPPGQWGEIVWQFNRAGTFDFACLLPGHFEAGMTGRIVVTPSAQP